MGMAVVMATQPAGRADRPHLDVAYTVLVGRIELRSDAEVTLSTPAGPVLLLPNRYGVLVGDLGGCEVEIEGLLLTIERRPLLWIEGIRPVAGGSQRPPSRNHRAAREIPI
jgi:hypothetical protein